MRSLTLIPLLAVCAGAVQAQAQSSVTLYGVVDVAYQFLNADTTLQRVQSGALSGSRLGLRGSEDLGGGAKALFTLESGLNADDGEFGQGAFWGRQAWVGLESGAGRLTLGRQYSSLYAVSDDFSVFGNRGFAASTGVIGGFGTSPNSYEPVRGSSTVSTTGNGGPARVNNAIKYESPAWAGLKLGALVGQGEATDGHITDLYARYAAGSFDGLLSYVEDINDGSIDRRNLSFAASYKLGDARVLGGVIRSNDGTAANQDGLGLWVGGDYRIGAHLLRAQYVRSQRQYGNQDKAQALGLGYQYDLSKRTALYTSIARVSNSDTAGYTGRLAGSLPTGVTITSVGNNDVSEFVAGVRHSF